MNIPALLNKYNGQTLSYDGIPANAGQCVQWVEYVLTDNQYGYGLAPFWGNAIDWWNNFSGVLASNFDRVPVSAGPPKAGDLVIWGSGVGSVYGHIDLCTADGDANGFQGYDTNWGGNKTVHAVQHNYNAVIGYLRSKSNQGTNAMIPDQDNWYGRFEKLMWQIRGRDLPRDEFKTHFVGVEPFHMVEILSDDPEADAALAAQGIGQVADRDNWQGQIGGLEASAKDLQARLDATNKQVADVTAENTVLKQQVAAADAQIKDPNKIIVTNKGWSALWVAIQSFFQKNN